MLRVSIVFCSLGLALTTPPLVRSREEIEAFKNYLENTQKDKPINIIAFPLANPEENSGKFEGDIVLDNWMIEEMVQEYAEGRNAVIRAGTKWPNNTVIWEYAQGVFRPSDKAAIEEAIADIERHTCIKFRYRELTDSSYVNVTGAPDGCYAHVGYWATRGPHIFNLQLDSYCFRHATIVHEWMHILGFFHMHSTYNRDDYIKVAVENVQPAFQYAFDKYESDMVSNVGIEYDYVSCLHYHAFAFSMNGLPTIIALQDHEGVIGQREYITDKDWLRINRHYDCPGAWD